MTIIVIADCDDSSDNDAPDATGDDTNSAEFVLSSASNPESWQV